MNLSDRERRLLVVLAAFIVVVGAAMVLLRGGGDEVVGLEPFPSATPSAEVSVSPVSPTPTVFIVPPGTRDPFKA